MRTAYLECGGHRLLARNPPERGHGSGARPTRTRACGCNSGAHTHRRAVRPPDAPELLQVCTASGRSRQLRARRPLSAEAFGHGPSRARGNTVGCGRYRLQGQLRCKSTNEPVHSNIFPVAVLLSNLFVTQQINSFRINPLVKK